MIKVTVPLASLSTETALACVKPLKAMPLTCTIWSPRLKVPSRDAEPFSKTLLTYMGRSPRLEPKPPTMEKPKPSSPLSSTIVWAGPHAVAMVAGLWEWGSGRWEGVRAVAGKMTAWVWGRKELLLLFCWRPGTNCCCCCCCCCWRLMLLSIIGWGLVGETLSGVATVADSGSCVWLPPPDDVIGITVRVMGRGLLLLSLVAAAPTLLLLLLWCCRCTPPVVVDGGGGGEVWRGSEGGGVEGEGESCSSGGAGNL